MSLLTLTDARALIETDLTDPALQALLDAADADIIANAGAHASASQIVIEPRSDTVFLRRDAASITTVVERIDGTATTLAATDYRLAGAHMLRRLATGANPRREWGDEIEIVYVPVADLPRRRAVQADLVKLAIQYQGARSVRVGDVATDLPEYDAERRAILSRLWPAMAAA